MPGQFSCERLPGGIVMRYEFSMGWEVNIAMHNQTRGCKYGLWDVMILVPKIVPSTTKMTISGIFHTVNLEWQTWRDVADIIAEMERGDRNVLLRRSSPAPEEFKSEHGAFWDYGSEAFIYTQEGRPVWTGVFERLAIYVP